MFQYCIIGGGPAGLVLANALRRHVSPQSIVILEAGGANDENEKMSKFVSVGQTEYQPIRSFRLGGHGHLWGGACPRLHPNDFQMKSRFGIYEDWPIRYSDLKVYYDQAEEILSVNNHKVTIPAEARSDPIVSELINKKYDDRLPYGNQSYFVDILLPELQESGVTILTDCVVRRLDESDDVTTVTYYDFQLGETRQLAASVAILCCGGLSNARILQLSKSSAFPNGIGNHSGLLGAYHMDHPRISVEIESMNAAETLLKDGPLQVGMIKPVNDQNPELAFASITIRRQNRVQIDRESIESILRSTFNSTEFQNKLKTLLSVTDRISFDFETMDPPFKKNRLELSEQLDEIGDPMLATNINIDAERAIVDGSILSLMRDVFERVGYQVISVGKSGWTGQHPSGSTRMAKVPEKGVVDENLRVFETNSIYVLGSSVFPTVGYANPTLTIVSLALRLADHFLEARK